MKASDIMTKDVITVGDDTTVKENAALMTKHRISGLPVVSADGKLTGIVSESDLLRRAETGTERRRKWWLGIFNDADSLAREFAKTHGLKAHDVMSSAVVTVDADAELRVVVEILDERSLKRLPVLSDGRLVGIITRGDLVRALAGTIAADAPESRDDASLYQDLMVRMRKEPWLNTTLINLGVNGGVVDLIGVIPSADQRRALRILIEETPGVTRVNENLRVGPLNLTI